MLMKGYFMTKQERKRELQIEYNNFIKTESGKEWKEHWNKLSDSDDCGDFGDYLYDFYPEMLM